jgi:hypothetical protein
MSFSTPDKCSIPLEQSNTITLFEEKCELHTRTVVMKPRSFRYSNWDYFVFLVNENAGQIVPADINFDARKGWNSDAETYAKDTELTNQDQYTTPAFVMYIKADHYSDILGSTLCFSYEALEDDEHDTHTKDVYRLLCHLANICKMPVMGFDSDSAGTFTFNLRAIDVVGEKEITESEDVLLNMIELGLIPSEFHFQFVKDVKDAKASEEWSDDDDDDNDDDDENQF